MMLIAMISLPMEHGWAYYGRGYEMACQKTSNPCAPLFHAPDTKQIGQDARESQP